MKAQLVSALLLCVGIAAAQQNQEMQPKPPSTDEFISRLDKNGDGQISKSEFDGPSDLFSQFDVNGDGYISKDEVPDGPPPGGPPEQDDDRTKGGPPPHSEKDFITRFDQDGDGKISAAEFSGPPGYFEYLDKDEDGYISAEEAPKQPPKRPSDDRNSESRK